MEQSIQSLWPCARVYSAVSSGYTNQDSRSQEKRHHLTLELGKRRNALFLGLPYMPQEQDNVQGYIHHGMP